MNITWDAEKYTADFSFVHQYGNGVAELIDAASGSSVLDLGCGNGALTKALQDKGYRVIGMVASEEFLEVARKNYPAIEFVQGDAANFVLPEPVDVVFSNAVFHWIEKEKQPDMIKCVYNTLKENGQFVFEFGGCNNNQRIHSVLAKVFQEYGFCYQVPFYFPTIGEYASLLESAGFQVKYAVLFDRLTELKGENGMEEWINMFVKRPFTVIPSEREKEAIINRTVRELRQDLFINGKWYADYVRLRMKAVRFFR